MRVTLATHKWKKSPNNLQQITDIENFKTRAVQWTNYEHEYTGPLRKGETGGGEGAPGPHHFLEPIFFSSKSENIKFLHENKM